MGVIILTLAKGHSRFDMFRTSLSFKMEVAFYILSLAEQEKANLRSALATSNVIEVCFSLLGIGNCPYVVI